MSKKAIIGILIVLVSIYVAVYVFIEFPVDCFPTIGPRPILRAILETFFRTRCVTI